MPMDLSLPNSALARGIGMPVLCTGTRHWKAGGARSPAEFGSKIEGGLQREETARWLEMPAGSVAPARLTSRHQEADDLTAILVKSVTTASKQR
jgi:hypothetical protein